MLCTYCLVRGIQLDSRLQNTAECFGGGKENHDLQELSWVGKNEYGSTELQAKWELNHAHASGGRLQLPLAAVRVFSHRTLAAGAIDAWAVAEKQRVVLERAVAGRASHLRLFLVLVVDTRIAEP